MTREAFGTLLSSDLSVALKEVDPALRRAVLRVSAEKVMKLWSCLAFCGRYQGKAARLRVRLLGLSKTDKDN